MKALAITPENAKQILTDLELQAYEEASMVAEETK